MRFTFSTAVLIQSVLCKPYTFRVYLDVSRKCMCFPPTPHPTPQGCPGSHPPPTSFSPDPTSMGEGRGTKNLKVEFRVTVTFWEMYAPP